MTPPTAIRILLVEDNPLDTALVRALLSNVGPELASSLEQVGRADEAVRRLGAGGVDLVLLDLNLPDSRGVVTVERVTAAAPGVPVVVLTGVDDEEVELQALAASAADYVVKATLNMRHVQRALQRARRAPSPDGARHEVGLPDDGATLPSVLVAGEHGETLFALGLILRSEGYETGLTSDLPAFATSSAQPDVLVLSVDDDSSETLGLLESATHMGCPTVAVVRSGESETGRWLGRAGIDAVVDGPISNSNLLAAVEHVLESGPLHPVS